MKRNTFGKEIAMLTTRPKIIAATGLLGLAGLFGGTVGVAVSGSAAAAMGPGQHQASVPNPHEGAVMAAVLSDYPDPQVVPNPFQDAIPNPWEE